MRFTGRGVPLGMPNLADVRPVSLEMNASPMRSCTDRCSESSGSAAGASLASASASASPGVSAPPAEKRPCSSPRKPSAIAGLRGAFAGVGPFAPSVASSSCFRAVASSSAVILRQSARARRLIAGLSSKPPGTSLRTSPPRAARTRTMSASKPSSAAAGPVASRRFSRSSALRTSPSTALRALFAASNCASSASLPTADRISGSRLSARALSKAPLASSSLPASAATFAACSSRRRSCASSFSRRSAICASVGKKYSPARQRSSASGGSGTICLAFATGSQPPGTRSPRCCWTTPFRCWMKSERHAAFFPSASSLNVSGRTAAIARSSTMSYLWRLVKSATPLPCRKFARAMSSGCVTHHSSSFDLSRVASSVV